MQHRSLTNATPSLRAAADHTSMVRKFEAVMVKLATVGHDPRSLTDCSEVIPVPANVQLPPPTLPAGKTLKDVEAAVRRPRSPSLSFTDDRALVRMCLSDTVPCESFPRHPRCSGPRHHRRACVRPFPSLVWIWCVAGC